MRMLVLISLAGLAGKALAAAECTTFHQQDPAALLSFQFESDDADLPKLPDSPGDYRVGEIRVIRQPIFESPGGVWFKEAANRFHVTSREATIVSAVTFEKGDRVGRWSLEEAERVLRRKPYFYDVRVIPRRLCGEVLDIDVVTRDVWTLNPRLDLTRTGGENNLGFGLSDTNVLGLGKTVSFGYQRDQDREGWSFLYVDPNVGGSRWSMDTELANNDDGSLTRISVARPFYSLTADYGVGFDTSTFDRDHSLYLLGDDYLTFAAETRAVSVFAGRSLGYSGDVAVRVYSGIRFEEHDFDLPPELDQDRKLVYPYVGVESIENRFEKRLNVDRIQRTEDVNLGRRWYLEIGYSDDAFGGDGQEIVYRGLWRDARWIRGDQLLSYGTSVNGRYDLELKRTEDLFADLFVRYLNHHADQLSLLVTAVASASRRASIDRGLLLGGETGMRGYPNRYQSGDRRFVVTVEERYYSDIYPFRMFRLGGAVFADVGRAWFEDDAPVWVPGNREGAAFDVLVDAGVGLRLESTRTRRDRVLHLDVAFPMTDGPDIGGVEITLTVKQSL